MDTIESNRLYCAKLEDSDRKSLVKLYTDNDTRKYLGGSILLSDAQKKVNNILKSDSSIFKVCLKENNEFIGLIYIEKYYDNKSTEISYEFLSKHWKKGYAYEIMIEVLKYCKNKLNLKYVIAETQELNKGSINLLNKLGYFELDRLIRFNEKQIVYRKNL